MIMTEFTDLMRKNEIPVCCKPVSNTVAQENKGSHYLRIYGMQSFPFELNPILPD